MVRGGQRALVFLFCLVFGVAAGGPAGVQRACASTVFAGNIKLVEGVSKTEYVKVIRPGFTKILEGKPGDAVFEGDTIKTGAGMKAQIDLSDHTVITLAPNASLQISGYLADRATARRNSVFRALKGTIRFVVAKIFKSPGNDRQTWKHSSVTIETISAVAGVRGTDLFASVLDGEVEFAVLEGVVSVRGSQFDTTGEVFLGENQVSRTKAGGRPGPAELLSPDRRNVLKNETTLVKPISRASGDARTKNAKTRKYEKEDIERDLAAGTPLNTLMDKAVESGMTIEEFTAAAIDAGANPAAVVYIGIQEGYSPGAIVEAAIESGAPAQDVFSAALSSGADQQSVISGSQEAGLSAGDIAGALTNTTTTDLSATNVATPESITPTTIIPPVLMPISGGATGGGGTPSASPYIP